MHQAVVHANISINANGADQANSLRDAIQLRHIWLVRSPATTAIIRNRTTALPDGTANLAKRRKQIKLKSLNYLKLCGAGAQRMRDANVDLHSLPKRKQECELQLCYLMNFGCWSFAFATATVPAVCRAEMQLHLRFWMWSYHLEQAKVFRHISCWHNRDSVCVRCSHSVPK